jgi:hypothetical protein
MICMAQHRSITRSVEVLKHALYCVALHSALRCVLRRTDTPCGGASATAASAGEAVYGDGHGDVYGD